MLKRLNGSWYLTDGILSPVRLDAPGCVSDALRGAGLLADGESAAELLKSEWIYRREWRYSLSPEGGFPADGRAYVSLFGLHGEWTVLLDGRELARGDGTEAEIALPAGVRGSTLTLVFARPGTDALWPRVGMDGGCLLRTVGGAALRTLSLNAPDDAPWAARAVVWVECACTCDVRCTLDVGGVRTEALVRTSLVPGENHFEHVVRNANRPSGAEAVGYTADGSGRAAGPASGAGSVGYAAAGSEHATDAFAAGSFGYTTDGSGRAADTASGAKAVGYAADGSGRAADAFGADSLGYTATESGDAESVGHAAGRVSLRMELLIDGAVSDARDVQLYLSANNAAPRGFAGADAVVAALAADAGANALCAPDTSRARMAAVEHDLTFVPYHMLATQRAMRACQRYEALLKLAGDEGRISDPALWLLTGCDPHAPEFAGLLSPDGNMEEVCRRSRYRQAVSLRDAAEHARMKRIPFLLDGARDEFPACASSALFDLDGAPRPAYFALADAWRSEHAFVMPPESFPADGIVSVPVFYLSDEKTPPCTVNVRAYSMDGRELITAGFPVPGHATDIVGRLCVEMPEDGLLLLRASILRDGSCVSRSDRLLTLNEDCLSALRPVQLLLDGASLRNVSACAAVGVSVPAARYFGALLPGETLPLDEPRLTLFESLNALM